MSTADEMNYAERVAHYRGRVPDNYKDEYETLLDDGRAPHIAAAVADYVAAVRDPERAVTQRKIAAEYDISEITIRNHYSTIAPDLNPQPTSAHASSAGRKTPASREVFALLYNSEDPVLETADIRERSSYTYGTVTKVLRELTADRAVGNRYTSRTSKAWWAVPRNDTPSFNDAGHTHNDERPVDILRDLADARDWVEKESVTDDYGHYSITHSYSGPGSPNIIQAGITEITGVSEPLQQVESLQDEFGLVPERDFSISINIKTPGMKKLRDASRPESHSNE